MPAEPQTTSQSLGEAAAAYTAFGLKVFPLHGIVADSRTGELRCSCAKGSSCASPGKHPLARLAPHGSHDATPDTIVVAEWWQSAPYANVAIATGTPAGEGRSSRLGVVDVDAGHNGFASLRALVVATPGAKDAWAAMRAAPKVATGGGGAHFYVVSDERANFAGAAGTDREGVDFRGTGGYVVAPPSRHISGARYRWVTPLESATMPALPDPLAEWLRPPAKPAVPAGVARMRSYLDEVTDPLLRRRLAAYRDAVVADVEGLIATAPNGRQHAALFTASCRIFDLARAGLLAHDEARRLLMVAGSSMTSFDAKRPWSEAEIARHVDGAWAWVAGRGTAGLALPHELAAALGIASANGGGPPAGPSPTARPAGPLDAHEVPAAAFHPEPPTSGARPAGEAGEEAARVSGAASLAERIAGDGAVFDEVVGRLVAAADHLAKEGTRHPHREVLSLLRDDDPDLPIAIGLAAARRRRAPASAAGRCLAGAMAEARAHPALASSNGASAAEEIAALLALCAPPGPARRGPGPVDGSAPAPVAEPAAQAIDTSRAHAVLEGLAECARALAGRDPVGAQRVVARLSAEHPLLLDALGSATLSLVGPLDVDVTADRMVEIVVSRRQLSRKSLRTSADNTWCKAIRLCGDTPRPTTFPDAPKVEEDKRTGAAAGAPATKGSPVASLGDVDALAYQAVFAAPAEARRATEEIAAIETRRAASIVRRVVARRGAGADPRRVPATRIEELAAETAEVSMAALSRWDPSRGIPFGAYAATVMTREAIRATSTTVQDREAPAVSLDALGEGAHVAENPPQSALPSIAELTEGLPDTARALLLAVHEGGNSVAAAAGSLGMEAAAARRTLKLAYAELARRPEVRAAAHSAGLDPTGRDVPAQPARSRPRSSSASPHHPPPLPTAGSAEASSAGASSGASGYFAYLAR
ncbi:MAG: bifunctional DNA primase/polymerase [Actinomycetota bacterium]|nr:bifunctional DNA primase/polymerase [Actinomycetota bacterium]